MNEGHLGIDPNSDRSDIMEGKKCFLERKKNTTSNELNRQNRCKINLFVKNSLVFRFVVLQRKDQNIVDESIIKGVKMRRVLNDKSNKVFILLNMIL